MLRVSIATALVAAAAYGFYANVSSAAEPDFISRACITDAAVSVADHAAEKAAFRADCDLVAARGGYKEGFVTTAPTHTDPGEAATCGAGTTFYKCIGVPGT